MTVTSILFIYRQRTNVEQRNNEEQWQQQKTLKEITICLGYKLLGHVPKAAGIGIFFDPKKWERSRGNK